MPNSTDTLAQFRQRLNGAHGQQLQAVIACLKIAAKLMDCNPTNEFQRLSRIFLASMIRSLGAITILCSHGHGADSICIARSMLEVLINLKYLTKRPSELLDFVEFDSVVRWRRIEFYKKELPQLYSGFPDSKKTQVEKDYLAVRDRFIGANGKVRANWCKHSISQMAKIAGLKDLYEAFYPYASAIHHANPMGVTMLADPHIRGIKFPPHLSHIGVALGASVLIMAEANRTYAYLYGVDVEEALRAAEQKGVEQAEYDGDVVGSIGELFPQ